MKLDRRTLLIGGGAGVGLVVAWALWPGGLDSELAEHEGSARFGNYLRIGSDGAVTVAVPQVESGQGSWTALPQILADELGAAWEKVAVEPAPLLAAYANPLGEQEGWLAGFGTLRRWSLERDGALRITADATSVRAFEQPLREAGAVARAMLVGAAAERWDVEPGECEAVDGFVVDRGKRLGFGELAEEAAASRPPLRTPLRSDGNLIGKALARLDGPAKSDGSWRFAGDVRLPDLLFASARLAPPGGKLEGFDRDSIRRARGVRNLAATDGWIAVVADTWWQAERALHSANPRFSARAGQDDDVRAPLDRALAAGDFDTLVERGDYWSAVEGARPLEATYSIAPSQHFALEPPSATARLRGGIAELWAATQAPGLARAAAGEDAQFYPMAPGDPAGRGFASPLAPIALHLAGATGRPVQVTLPQTMAQMHDPLSPGALVRITALPGAGGITATMRMDVVTADGMAASLGGEPAAGLQPRRFEGAVPYGVPSLLVRGASVRLPYRIGYMRGSPWRETAFAMESFIDELARAAGLDPLGLRMALLGENGRLARCLQAAARRAGWDGGGPGSNLGIAGTSAFGSHVALVADATISPDQRVQVHNLVCAVDCGRVVNAGLMRQQIEGALIWALGQATATSPDWRGAMPVARRLAAVDLPGMKRLPKIDIVIIPSSAAPGGVNGLGAIPLAPAIANAVFAGTGRRMRSLPFDPMSAA